MYTLAVSRLTTDRDLSHEVNGYVLRVKSEDIG